MKFYRDHWRLRSMGVLFGAVSLILGIVGLASRGTEGEPDFAIIAIVTATATNAEQASFHALDVPVPRTCQHPLRNRGIESRWPRGGAPVFPAAPGRMLVAPARRTNMGVSVPSV